MKIHEEVEQIRQQQNIPDFEMCNIMNVSESLYDDIKNGRALFSLYGLIMFISYTRHPLYSLDNPNARYLGDGRKG